MKYDLPLAEKLIKVVLTLNPVVNFIYWVPSGEIY